MNAQDLFQDILWFTGQGGYGIIGNHKDCNSLPRIDGTRELGFSEVVVEGAERWVLAKETGDVEGIATTEEERERDEEMDLGLHW